MDALEAFGDGGAHTQQQWAFGGPVTRAAGTVLFAGDNEQRDALLLVAHGGVVDGRFFAIGQVDSVVAFFAWHETIAQADIAEGATHHDFVIAAPSAVGVEVAFLYTVLEQVFTGRAGGSEIACRRDVVSGDRVVQHG